MKYSMILKFVFLILIFNATVYSQTNRILFDQKENPLTDFNNIDNITLWNFEITYLSNQNTDSISSLAFVKFFRIEPEKIKVSKRKYENWKPSMYFDVYNLKDSTYCKKISNKTEKMSSCVTPNQGGDLIIIGNYIFLNNHSCISCSRFIEEKQSKDYCRPIINKILTEIDISDKSSLKQIEHKIQDILKKASW
jgi:hypothetical protein